MNIFEIRITNTDDKNDVSTMEYITQEEDTTAEHVMERVGQAVNFQHDLEFHFNTRYVTISACSDDEGYYYNVYASKEAYENDEESEDGGQCTGTISDAISMAIN